MEKTTSLEFNPHELAVLWLALRAHYDRASEQFDNSNEVVRDIARRQADDAVQVSSVIEKAIIELAN